MPGFVRIRLNYWIFARPHYCCSQLSLLSSEQLVNCSDFTSVNTIILDYQIFIYFNCFQVLILMDFVLVMALICNIWVRSRQPGFTIGTRHVFDKMSAPFVFIFPWYFRVFHPLGWTIFPEREIEVCLFWSDFHSWWWLEALGSGLMGGSRLLLLWVRQLAHWWTRDEQIWLRLLVRLLGSLLSREFLKEWRRARKGRWCHSLFYTDWIVMFRIMRILGGVEINNYAISLSGNMDILVSMKSWWIDTLVPKFLSVKHVETIH